MRCVIVTIYDRSNYGNRLQNYAVQCVMEKMEVKAETVIFEKDILTWKKYLKYYLQKLFCYRLPGDAYYWKYMIPHIRCFEKFNKKYINTLKWDMLSKSIDKIDYFILGSDQVWNPSWYDNLPIKKEMYLLTFARPDQKVCFSPSFGLEELPNRWKPWFREKLLFFPKLSVREESGAEIIRKLTGKEAEVLIDPTMMLDAEDWMKIARKPKKVDCAIPYILTYYLGGRSERVNTDIERYATENGLAVWHLLDRERPDVYEAGPREFIYLVAHASLILTDSFHACVFSFLFRKPFLVYPREGRESRILSRMDTLLKKFDLQRKYVDGGLKNDVLECDYTVGYQRLETERRKVITFLRESMALDEGRGHNEI